MLSKPLIQFSIDGWSCVPSLLFTWGQTMVEVMKMIPCRYSFKRSHACNATVQASNPLAGHHQPMPSPETPGHPVSCGVTVPFSWVLVHLSHQGSPLMLLRTISPPQCLFTFCCFQNLPLPQIHKNILSRLLWVTAHMMSYL